VRACAIVDEKWNDFVNSNTNGILRHTQTGLTSDNIKDNSLDANWCKPDGFIVQILAFFLAHLSLNSINSLKSSGIEFVFVVRKNPTGAK